MKHFFRRLVSLTFLPAIVLSAQSESDDISIRFSTFAWAGSDTRELFYRHNGQLEPLKVSQAFYKGPFDYTGPNPMVFYKKVPAADGTIQIVPVASVPIDPALTDVFLLFLKGSAAASEAPHPPLRIVSMNNQLDEFPKGGYRIYNLSDYEVGGIFSDQRFTIPANSSKTIDLNGTDHVDVRIHFSTKVDGEWISQINTRWRHDEQTRNIVFVTDDPNSRHPKLKLKTITQYFTE